MLNEYFGIQLSNEAKAAVIGALVGGTFALAAPLIEHFLVRRREKLKVEQARITFLKSLAAELVVLRERYMLVVGNNIEAYNENGDSYFEGGIIQNQHEYFTYYDNNADKLQLIGDEQELINKIMQTYIYLKSLFDSWVEYGGKYIEHANLLSMWNVDRDERIGKKIGASSRKLKKMSKLIKEEHFQTKAIVDNTIKYLNRM